MSDSPLLRRGPSAALTEAISTLSEVAKAQLAWFQSQASGDFTRKQKKRLEEFVARVEGAITRTEENMGIKISELKTEVAGIRTQVKKIWDEQQKKYDDLVVKFNALEATLANAELDEDTTKEVADFKSELKAFDDTIPDTTG
jgi:hypothetical protein